MDIEKQIWARALDFLKIRLHSREELRRKLCAKFPEESGAISRALDEMERVELINDRRFTEGFVQYLIQKPIGRMKIMTEARLRGLDLELAENMLISFEWDEEKSAAKALEEKKRSLTEKDPRKYKMKLVNFLRNRGFKDSTIYKILK